MDLDWDLDSQVLDLGLDVNSALHWDSDMLQDVVVWEVKQMRRVLNLRPKSSEDCQFFRTKS